MENQGVMKITRVGLLVAVGLSLGPAAFPSKAVAEPAGSDRTLEDIFPPMNNAPPEIPSGAAEAARQGSGALTKEGDFVSLNFDSADIGMVVQTVAELLKINYILAPGVSGKVTIQTSGRIAVSELLFVLEKMLEVNNLSMVKSGDFYKIIPAGSVAREGLGTLGPDEAPAGPGMVIKIFQLTQIAPSEVIKIFGALKSPQGVFIPHDPANLLFVLETPERLAMFGDLIASVDVDAYRSVQVEMYPVRHSQADELARDLAQVLTAAATVPGRAAAKFKLVPVKALNTLILVSAEPGLGALMKRWVNDLDRPAAAEADKVFVHYLDHAGADNVASVLRELYFEKGMPSAARTAGAPSPAAPESAAGKGGQPLPAAPAERAGGGGGVSGKVKVVSDKDGNAVIIQTAPRNYPVVLETIRMLDKRPQQVLIEVTIAEIRLDDEDDFGIEWSLLSQGTAKTGGETFNVNATARNAYNLTDSGGLSQGLGFSYLVTEAGRLSAVLNAYAKASKLNIISRPRILASDNKEAKIDVGQEVPIITTQTRTGENDDKVDQTIEYRSTGIILTVTPHINEGGDVSLDVLQEVSEAQTNLLGGTDSPIILKRSTKTSMVVKDNETLVIGGLIQQTKGRTREGIPLLSRIPLIGYLFGTTKDTRAKDELLVLLTPRVITRAEDGNRLTERAIDEMVILKKGLTGK